MATKLKLCIDCASHYQGVLLIGTHAEHMCSQGQEPTVDPVDGSVTYDQLKTCGMHRAEDGECWPEGRLWTTKSPAPSMMRGDCGDPVCTPIPPFYLRYPC